MLDSNLDHYLGGNLEYVLDSGLTFDQSHTLAVGAIPEEGLGMCKGVGTHPHRY